MAGRIFVTGDMHGGAGIYRLQNGVFGKQGDVLLVAGDWGMPFTAPQLEDEALDQIAKFPWTTVFIDGNHENFPLLWSYPEDERFGGIVGTLRPNIFHLKQRGHIYTINDKTFWCFGGALSHDKECRVKGYSWWPEEEATDDEIEYGLEQLKQNNGQVDYMLTHDCPLLLYELNPRLFKSHDVVASRTNKYLDRAAKIGRAELWIFGHHHIDIDITNADPYPNRRFRAIYRDILRLV